MPEVRLLMVTSARHGGTLLRPGTCVPVNLAATEPPADEGIATVDLTRRRKWQRTAAGTIALILGLAAMPGGAPTASAHGAPESTPTRGSRVEARPDVIAAVTRAGHVVLLDGRSGAVRERIFSSYQPRDPGAPRISAQSVEVAPDGLVYYELNGTHRFNTIRVYEQRTGETAYFAEGRNPAVRRDGEVMAVASPTGGIDRIRLEDGNRRPVPPPEPTGIGTMTFIDRRTVIADTLRFDASNQLGLSSVDVDTGAWRYPRGKRGHLADLQLPEYRTRSTFLATYDPDYELGGRYEIRQIRELNLSGSVDRLLLRGRWNTYATSTRGQWLVAAGTDRDRSLTFLDPDGERTTVRPAGAKRLTSIDW